MTDTELRCVFVPPVRCFKDVEPDKSQALKVLEEAAGVFGAWQRLEALKGYLTDSGEDVYKESLIDRCADVIQATCNMLYSLGVTDMAQPMGACEQRNRERGGGRI